MMKKLAAALAAGLAVTGCATTAPAVPQGYAGPVATIRDSFTSLDQSAANVFCLNKLDGREIDDSLGATRGASYGHGAALMPVALERKVPAQAATFHIIGRTTHAAPIQSLTQAEYQVVGDVHFTPQAEKIYVVRGELDKSHSVVWIEDQQSHEVMDKRIEIQGDAHLGFFEK
jgi:hypothetical protein